MLKYFRSISFFLTLLILLTIIAAQNTALDFDGSNDYINITDNASLTSTNAITISAWFKKLSSSNWMSLVGKGTSDANEEYVLMVKDDQVYFDVGQGGGPYLQQSTTISIGVWHHIAAVHTRSGSTSTLKVYLNGKDVGGSTVGASNSPNDNSHPLTIGSRFSTSNAPFQGQIDEVRIWSEARSQAEIKANMHTELSSGESNLVAYYNFNEGTGTTVSDMSSNSNNGTMTNMANDDWISNSLFAQDYSLDLDGSNDYVQVADDNALDISSSITVSAWIYPTNIANKDGIISKRTSTENSGDWAFRLTSAAKLKLLIWDGDANNGSTSSTNAISTNTWTHIAFTHDNSTNTTKFYINGSLDATGTGLSKNLAGNNSNVYIGWDGQQGDKFFTGKIDEVRIWDDVRAQTEIQDYMYKELIGNESNLVAYYNFNDGRGTSALDLTSNNNNGTMINMDANSDWTDSKILGASITGNSGFRMLSSPISGQILGNLLTNLWTQGMTGADITTATANVWTLNVSGQSWTALSDISSSGTSLAAGQGFLVYVFEDTDNDGTADLPATINVNGTENNSDATYDTGCTYPENICYQDCDGGNWYTNCSVHECVHDVGFVRSDYRTDGVKFGHYPYDNTYGAHLEGRKSGHKGNLCIGYDSWGLIAGVGCYANPYCCNMYCDQEEPWWWQSWPTKAPASAPRAWPPYYICDSDYKIEQDDYDNAETPGEECWNC